MKRQRYTKFGKVIKTPVERVVEGATKGPRHKSWQKAAQRREEWIARITRPRKAQS
jgi:hypothetical protein